VTVSREAGCALLERGSTLAHDFALPASGEAWVELTLVAPGTSWARGEAAVASLDVDGREPQQLVLAADEPVEYARLLGRLAAGPHRLSLRLDAALSAAGAGAIECRGIRTQAVADEDSGAFVWRHAPVLHYRALDGPLDGLSTDTPLLLFHRPVETPEGRGVEYHVIFSHEDVGTDLTGLLAGWGHTTDIEWVFRVVRDACGRIVREEFQGPEHITRPFRGARALGGHAVLQVATRNGMVTDRVTCSYRAAFAPVVAQPAGEPREGVQYRFPWIHRVSALEVIRQERLEGEVRSASPVPADPRAYVYLQFSREADAAVPALEALARIRGVWHGSAWSRPELAMRGEDAESTAIKLPPGAGAADVEAIAVRAIDLPADTGPAGIFGSRRRLRAKDAPATMKSKPPRAATVRFVRAFCLDDRCYPCASFAAPAVCALSAGTPEAIVWRRSR
jgi:hypothetical protein